MGIFDMDIVDELMTPGCPQCAVKHLSAALYHVTMATGELMVPCSYMRHICTAYINLIEVRSGYKSHLWYAVGALVRAEEKHAYGVKEHVAREARLLLEQRGEDAVPDALRVLDEGIMPTHADWAAAHFDEACRELPAMAHELHMSDLVGSIEKVREFYFDLPPSIVPGETETNQTEKEPNMATVKKTPAKGTKCATKGGKTAATAPVKGSKCACKGGKTKK